MRRIRTLSQGMKQQLTLAIAYETGARYLLLDEPMNALDPSRVDLRFAILSGSSPSLVRASSCHPTSWIRSIGCAM